MDKIDLEQVAKQLKIEVEVKFNSRKMPPPSKPVLIGLIAVGIGIIRSLFKR